MKCPRCKSPRTKVKDSRDSPTDASMQLRERECRNPRCGHLFATAERVSVKVKEVRWVDSPD